MPRAKESVRVYYEGVPHYFPEAGIVPGPETLRTYNDFYNAYTTPYAYMLDADEGRLRLWKWNGVSWVEVDSAEYPQPAHPIDEIRHLSLAFFYGYPIMVYERNGKVYMNDYNGDFFEIPNLVDPILVNSHLATQDLENYEPMYLFALTPDRMSLVLKRGYDADIVASSTAIAAYTFPEPAILDQAVVSPYQITLYGSFASAPNVTGFRLTSEPFLICCPSWLKREYIYTATVGSPSFGTVGSPNFGEVGFETKVNYAAMAILDPPVDWFYEY